MTSALDDVLLDWLKNSDDDDTKSLRSYCLEKMLELQLRLWKSEKATEDVQRLVKALEFLLKTYCHPSSSVREDVEALLEGKKAEK